jgi:DNA-binding NarL/FixJ family response regulator
VVSVLVVDDHPLFREGLAGLLATAPGVSVLGSAGDGPTAIELAAALRPDVVFMDLNMPGMSGLDATRALIAADPAVAVLVMTMVDDDAAVLAALQAGARGYVLKGADQDEVLGALRTVASGGAVFGAGVAAQVLALARGVAVPAAPTTHDDLTARERAVLDLIATGQSNAQIARTLGVSLKTVQNYVSRVLVKVQAADRTQAALRARGLG